MPPGKRCNLDRQGSGHGKFALLFDSLSYLTIVCYYSQADCLKLAERQFHFGDGYVEVIRLNGWVAAEGKCKLSM